LDDHQLELRQYHLRLWILGTVAIMATAGGIAGSLLRQWQELEAGSQAVQITGAPLPILGLVLGLMTLWFRDGYRLWSAVRARPASRR
jgi:hypothetical protein